MQVTLGVPRTKIEGVAGFYSFFYTQPRGKYRILFSDNITDRMQGNMALMEQLGVDVAPLAAQAEALRAQGAIVMHLAVDTKLAGILAVSDPVKATTAEALATLRKAGLRVVMATGDGLTTARAVGQRLGIDEVHGEVKPADKLKLVEKLQSEGRVVAMAGDGINDAPALARAEIGFAMAAAGTDTAIETADVALMDDDLRKIPAFIRLSRQTSSILKQNIALALVIKAVFLAVTFLGMATMWMAVFADMGVSLLVVFNGLRLLRK